MARPKTGQERLPPDDELAELVEAHGSYGAVARLFEVSPSSVAQRMWRLGRRSPARRTGLLTCAICGRDGLDEIKLLRFNLYAPKRGAMRNHRHSGLIDLCEGCWQTKRSRPYR